MFIRAPYRTVFRNKWVQPTLSDIVSLKSTLIFSHLHLVLRSVLFPSDFPTKTVFAILIRSWILHAYLVFLELTPSSLTCSYFSKREPSFTPVKNDRITVFHEVMLRFLDTGRKDKRLLHRPPSSGSSCSSSVVTAWTAWHWRWKHYDRLAARSVTIY